MANALFLVKLTGNVSPIRRHRFIRFFSKWTVRYDYSFCQGAYAGVTILTWQEDAMAEERMQDMEAAIEVGTNSKTMLSSYTEFDLSEIHLAVKVVSAPEKKGNIVLKF